MSRNYRRPYHAGSWYDSSESRLTNQIQELIDGAAGAPNAHASAIIGPHAGYSYCGHVLASAYKQIDPSKVSRVFLFGPSHHVYTRRCVLSGADVYRTPLGDIEIDQEIYQDLRNTSMFEVMDMRTDEEEHSLELHTPFIFHTLRDRQFKLVPIMFGNLSTARQEEYAKIFSPYLNDPSNLFVISTDFCHWGSRFQYTSYDEKWGSIWKYIEWLDQEGMRAIETGDPKVFNKYMKNTGNTICGQHPISVFLNMLDICDRDFRIKFTNYDQSSHCEHMSDSSVSYASAFVEEIKAA